MERISELFEDHYGTFTVYVVGNSFMHGEGIKKLYTISNELQHFKSDEMAQRYLNLMRKIIFENIPSTEEMVLESFDGKDDDIISLLKLLGTQKHQAINVGNSQPILLYEGLIKNDYIHQIIYFYHESTQKPIIVIVLQDNNFERIESLLSNLPHNTRIKFIFKDYSSEFRTIKNKGSQNITDFLEDFSQQYFSTCSRTQNMVLINSDWAKDSIIRNYAPKLLKYRANLLCDQKREISKELNDYCKQMQSYQHTTSHNRDIVNNLRCIALIYKVFCNDFGGADIKEAYNIANALNSELLLAYIYKLAYLFPNTNIEQQKDFLIKGYSIFEKYGMTDNAIYCKNNMLVRQFDSDRIYVSEFESMLGEAAGAVPGLVGMSHIYNNVALAYMMTGKGDRALELFEKGKEYSNSSERQVQDLAILCNKLITELYYTGTVKEEEINSAMTSIFNGMVDNKQLPFISARYATNLIVIAAKTNVTIARTLLEKFRIISLINDGLKANIIGSGQLKMQLDYLDKYFPELSIKSKCTIPSAISLPEGRRKKFIEESGLNPFYLFTWI